MTVEWWVVIVTLTGPVLAVQSQKWIERARESRDQRLRVFSALMANRGTRLADDFIRALNLIDLAFLPGRVAAFSKKDKAVIVAWHELRGEFLHGIRENEDDLSIMRAWNATVDEKLVALLEAMSIALGYPFTKEQLRRGSYYPRGRAETEQTQLAILNGFRNILHGDGALRLNIVAAPVNKEAAELQAALTDRMVNAYSKEGALKIIVIPSNDD